MNLRNTYSRSLEPFVPRAPARVTMYTCGPNALAAVVALIKALDVEKLGPGEAIGSAPGCARGIELLDVADGVRWKRS